MNSRPDKEIPLDFTLLNRNNLEYPTMSITDSSDIFILYFMSSRLNHFLGRWDKFSAFLTLITGAKYSGSINSLSSLLRKYLFPFLYSISIVILKFRYDKIFFSTEIFKKDTKHYLKNKKKYFDFYSYDAFDGIINKTFTKKSIDFLIYYRVHPNKNNIFIKDILKKIKEDFIVKTIGDNPFIDKIEYLGILNKKQLNNYLQKTKFTILSGENTSSLFFLDCINNNVSIFYNKESIPSYDLFKIKPSSLFPIDYKNPNQSLKEIYQIVPIEKHNIKKYNWYNFNHL